MNFRIRNPIDASLNIIPAIFSLVVNIILGAALFGYHASEFDNGGYKNIFAYIFQSIKIFGSGPQGSQAFYVVIFILVLVLLSLIYYSMQKIKRYQLKLPCALNINQDELTIVYCQLGDKLYKTYPLKDVLKIQERIYTRFGTSKNASRVVVKQVEINIAFNDSTSITFLHKGPLSDVLKIIDIKKYFKEFSWNIIGPSGSIMDKIEFYDIYGKQIYISKKDTLASLLVAVVSLAISIYLFFVLTEMMMKNGSLGLAIIVPLPTIMISLWFFIMLTKDAITRKNCGF